MKPLRSCEIAWGMGKGEKGRERKKGRRFYKRKVFNACLSHEGIRVLLRAFPKEIVENDGWGVMIGEEGFTQRSGVA